MPPPTNLLDPDEKNKSTEAHCPIVQQFEISDPIAKASWYKDGTQIYPEREADNESQSSNQTLPLQSQYMSGERSFGCDTSGDAQFTEDMKGVYLHCTCTFKKQQFRYMREAITQLIVFFLALSKQQGSVTMVTRLVR